MREKEFEVGELFIYKNGEKCELGKVKRKHYNGKDYFCWYHTGCTVALTPVDHMFKLVNAYCIEKELLGHEQ